MQLKCMAHALLVILAALPLTSRAHAGPAEDAHAAFSTFFPAFVTRNHAAVAAMFAPDAQFYGTASPELITKPEGVLRYFAFALDRPDIWLATPLQMTAPALSDNVVTLAGSWKIDRTVDGKTIAMGPYRMTAVMQKRNDRWIVVQFHNSPRPAPPAGPAK